MFEVFEGWKLKQSRWKLTARKRGEWERMAGGLRFKRNLGRTAWGIKLLVSWTLD
jgi:hypothetical protein